MDPVSLTSFVTILGNNIWVGLLSIFLYFLWRLSPKLFSTFEKYLTTKAQETNKLTEAINQNGNGLNKIGEAIHSFEKAMLGVEARMVLKMDEVQDELKDEIRDQKIADLQRITSQPDIPKSRNSKTEMEDEETQVLRRKGKYDRRTTNPSNIG